ncbi:PTS system, cellobiose-specific IIC component [Anaerobacillus alkalilacustris]|uniref:Permease IIC component n=1 Tax=Anaerobacillus alkalilacustris TaxID=393763 RepID=A0A1S2LVS2_9BACI|nr:PTS cellobiose transporter subunit IIC [Anaerobacillus alkalilacustris]OIJ16641.1 PTS system, cellobiose-specific IIC component [Anaerobacillus alkalilacustris]
MSKVNTFLENKVMPVAGKVAGQRHLNALRDGIILTMPLIIVGSLFLILAFLPIPGYADFMAGVFGDQWMSKLLYPVGVTFDIMALIACFGIAYRLAERYGIDALSSGAIAISSFLLATPFQILFTPEGAAEAVQVGGGIPLALMGSQGLFVGMLIAIFSTEIYRYIVSKDIVIKMPDGVPPAVAKSFVALIPGFVVISSIWILRIFVEMTSFGSIHALVTQIVGAPLTLVGGSLIGNLFGVFFAMLLWSVGLHGMNIVSGVMAPIWMGAMDENRIAFQAGEELPNIFTTQFIEMMNVGGSGATFALVIMMLLWARSQQIKQLGRLAAGPGAFNINEPIIFGMPIVMNPLLIIPFIITPLVTVIVTYFAMSLGIVAKPAGIAVPWTTPPILHGYLITGGNISGAIMQAVNILIAFAIWFPFFKIFDKQKVREEGGVSTPDETKVG